MRINIPSILGVPVFYITHIARTLLLLQQRDRILPAHRVFGFRLSMGDRGQDGIATSLTVFMRRMFS